MPNDEEKLKLSDLIDINLLQKFQDAFANAMGIASLTVDDNGPVTKPSNFSEFCTKFIKACEMGSKRYNDCDIESGKMAAEKGEPVIYTCHAGLGHFVIPIVVAGQHIASMLGGQFVLEKPNEEHFKNLAKELRISNESEYINALRKIKIHSKEHIKFASELLFILSTTISEIAYKNIELKNKNKKEKFYRKIIGAIRSSLNIDETLLYICEETAKLFNVQRTTVSEAEDYKNLGKTVIKMEFKTISEIKGSEKLANIPKLAEYFNKILQEGKILAVDNISESDTPDYFKEDYKSLGVKSILAIPVQKGKDKWGILILSEYNAYRHWRNDDIELAKSIASQIYISIKHAELYKKEKTTGEREKLLRNIIEALRSTFDIFEVKQKVITAIAETLNANRCYIAEFDEKIDKYLPISQEHLASSDLKSMIGYDVEKNIPELVDFVKKNPLVRIPNVDEFIEKNDFSDVLKDYFKTFDIKSRVYAKISYMQHFFGTLIVNFSEARENFEEQEIDFINTLSNQMGTALYQASLYEKEKETAQREILLRNIIEKIRSSLNLEETLFFICEETAKLFNVQRCAITSFPNPENYEIFAVRKEYKYCDDMEGFGFRQYSSKIAAYWADALIGDEETLAIDNIENSDTPDYFKNTYSSMGIKALIGISIRKGTDVWGTLVLAEYNNYRHWSKEEKKLLKTIADQVYIAINQAELFEKAQIKAENERTLKEIMLSSVNSLEVKDVINSIVIETGKLLKADRCFFIAIDSETDTGIPIKDYAEYLSSEDVVSHKTHQPSKEETGVFVEDVKNSRIRFSGDASQEDLPEATKKMFEELSVKSYLHIPVVYGNLYYGALVIHYIHDFRKVSQDEIDMAVAIANQSAIVLHQAELFELTKIQAQREKISKNIIEILRSTLDMSIIKRLFVKNIGQFLNADRVLFSEFNSEINVYEPVSADSEYLSNPNIKSFVGFDWSVPQAQEFIQPILEKREFHIYNWHEYIQGTYKSQDVINLFEDMNIKSSYSLPVMYQQKIMGFFSIGFVQKVHKLSEEDINRVRNICTQAGIALYHAHLYEEAQKSVKEHDEFVNKLSDELKAPLSLIAEFSAMKSEHELACIEEVEHLNKINDSAKKLLYFLEDITQSVKKLNLE